MPYATKFNWKVMLITSLAVTYDIYSILHGAILTGKMSEAAILDGQPPCEVKTMTQRLLKSLQMTTFLW